ncbi:unnamed protein product [Haemonchus placei]|uniref:Uncharacterized protein n=1 Tax=Haemonchus placei TaxID=6290 RepID=A0A3P7W805_HAEPC|nr:unnamed protein product [Haemonchus placei]
MKNQASWLFQYQMMSRQHESNNRLELGTGMVQFSQRHNLDSNPVVDSRLEP